MFYGLEIHFLTFQKFFQHCMCLHFYDGSLTMSNIIVTIFFGVDENLKNVIKKNSKIFFLHII